jgi:hypothetical protein
MAVARENLQAFPIVHSFQQGQASTLSVICRFSPLRCCCGSAIDLSVASAWYRPRRNCFACGSTIIQLRLEHYHHIVKGVSRGDALCSVHCNLRRAFSYHNNYCCRELGQCSADLPNKRWLLSDGKLRPARAFLPVPISKWLR